MTYAPTFSIKGEALEKTNLAQAVFEAKASPTLLAQAVRVYLGNQRQAGAKTKTRAMVAKTTAKMYKQKGTGRARHGSYAAPIFVGGGVALGPTGEQNYKRKMSGAMIKKALLGALTERAQEKRVVVVTGGDKATGKTKDALKLREKLGDLATGPVVVVTAQQRDMARGWRNLKGVRVIERDRLNTYEVLARKSMVITKEAMEELVKLCQ